MSRSPQRLGLTAPLLLVCGLLLAVAAGCGEKITIPEAEGLFSTSGYLHNADYPVEQLQQVLVANGLLYVLSADSLAKRLIDFELVTVGEQGIVLTGLNEARAMCASDVGGLIMVWEQGNHRLSWYSLLDLEFKGEGFLPEVINPVAIATARAGAAELGMDTFLYLSDPEAGVIHRYAFSEFHGLYSYGILASSDGDGTRFVHVPAGISRDFDGKLLVCDADPNRNWVIRFDSTPDPEDTTPDPLDEDPLRGKAVLFADQVCEPPATAEYVLGDAAGCRQDDWVGAPSDSVGEFHSPLAVTIDGLGRIFVADTGNDRVQAFTAQGVHRLVFGDEEDSPRPVSIGVRDEIVGITEDKQFFAAWIFLAHPDQGVVSRWVARKFFETLDDDYFDQ